jgi:membrane protease subunit (stomatin/prohibitin family)
MTSTWTCPTCGRALPAEAHFCTGCGARAPRVVNGAGARWSRPVGELAVRIEVDDLPGLLSKNLVVEPGTRALFLEDGRNALGVVGPGAYTLQTALDALPGMKGLRRVTAILLEGGEVTLPFALAGIYTADPLALKLDVVLAARIEKPMEFFVNCMQGRGRVTAADLVNRLLGEVEAAAAEWLARHTVAELGAALALREELATHIEEHLRPALRRLGLAFDRVTALRFRHERWDALRSQREDLFLQISEAEARAAGQRRLADVLAAAEVAQIAAETQRVARFEQRSQLWTRLRDAALADRLGDLRSAESFRQAVADFDRRRILDEEEIAGLAREVAARREDADLARAHLLAQLKLKQEGEQRLLAEAQRHDLSLAEIRHRAAEEAERQRTHLALEEERALWLIRTQRVEAEARQAAEAASAAAERELALQAQMAELERRLRAARNDAEIAAIEREQDRLDAELGLALLEKMKAVKRRDEQERRLFDLRIKREEAELALTVDERRLDMQLRAERERGKIAANQTAG